MSAWTLDHEVEPVLGIAEGLDLVLISADEVLVQYGTSSYPSELIRDTDLTGVLGRLVSRLQEGPFLLTELLEGLPSRDGETVRHLVDDLVGRGILVDAEATPVEQYLGYTLTGESTLSTKTVGLLGAGPIGVRLGLSLLAHGVGRLTALDDRPVDRVWMSCALPGGIARATAAPASIALRDLAGESGRVASLEKGLDPEGVEDAVSGCDFAILALEQPDPRLAHYVNRFCMSRGRPWLLVQLDGNLGLCGPLFIPTETACYSDFATLADAVTKSPQMARRYRRHLLERSNTSFFPGLPAHADVLAGFAALATVHFLSRGTCFALGRSVSIDFDRMMIDVQDVLKLPRCPVCSRNRAAYQPPFSAEIVTRVRPPAPTG